AEAPVEFLFEWAHAQRNLSYALRALNRPEDALAAARRAVSLARRRNGKNPPTDAILVESLCEVARCYRALHRLDEARATAEQAVQVARSIHAGRSTVDRVVGRALSLLTELRDEAASPTAADAEALADGQPSSGRQA